MQPIYVTSKAFTDAIAQIPFYKAPNVHSAPDRTPLGVEGSYNKDIQQAVNSSKKIVDKDRLMQTAIRDLISIVCKDYHVEETGLMAAGHFNVFCFNTQYVLSIGTNAQRIYALRKSPGRKIKGFSCFLLKYPGSYFEVCRQEASERQSSSSPCRSQSSDKQIDLGHLSFCFRPSPSRVVAQNLFCSLKSGYLFVRPRSSVCTRCTGTCDLMLPV